MPARGLREKVTTATRSPRPLLERLTLSGTPMPRMTSHSVWPSATVPPLAAGAPPAAPSASAFASPAKVGRHRQWFYNEARDKVLFNPEPEEAAGEAWEGRLRVLSENVFGETLRLHVRALAEAIGTVESATDQQSESNWIRRLQNYANFSSEDIVFLSDLRAVAVEAELSGVDWVVLVEPIGWKHGPEESLWMLPYWF